MNKDYKFHPIASMYGLMEGDDLAEMADDIRKHGLIVPIVLFEGMILDGRNRKTACLMAGVVPRYTNYTGEYLDAVAYVESINEKRRHLTSSQRAMKEVLKEKLCAEYAQQVAELKADAKGRKKRKPKSVTQQVESQIIDAQNGRNEISTDAKRAKGAGTNRQYIAAAKKIAAANPALAEEVVQGKKSIRQARKEVEGKSNKGPKMKSQRRKTLTQKRLSELIAVVQMLKKDADKPTLQVSMVVIRRGIDRVLKELSSLQI